MPLKPPTTKRSLLFPLLIAASAISAQAATTYNWSGGGTTGTGAGTSDGSGTWSTTTNWNPTGNPGSATNDSAFLPNVGSATNTAGTGRTITDDYAAANPLASLTLTQTSAFVNQLDLTTNLTVTNAVTLGATGGGTAEISVEAGFYFQNTNGLTLNSGGLAVLFGNGSIGKATTTPTAVTLSGGQLEIGGSTTASQVSSVYGALTMASGTIQIDNSGSNSGGTAFSTDRRAQFFGNLNITGGTVAVTGTTASQVTLSGATNVFNPASLTANGAAVTSAGGLSLTLNVNGAQTLTTNQSLFNGLTLRGSGVKTITLTGATTVGGISFIDNDTTITSGVGNGPSLKLGSNLTATTGAGMPSAATFSQSFDANAAIQVGIDTNGNTLDISQAGAFASRGTFTPNNGGTASQTTQYTFLNSGTAGTGSITSGAFVLNAAGTSTTVGPGVTLKATGSTNGSGGTSLNDVNNLGSASGTATIDPTSTFQYAGTASATVPATLTANRTIGALTVSSGQLQLVTTGLSVANNVTVASGAALQLGGQILTMTSGANLAGFGTVAGTTSNVVSTGNAVTFTGTGGIVPGTNGTVGALTLTGTQTLTLASTSNSLFDIVGSTTSGNDHVTLTPGAGTIALNYAGALTLNFNGITPTNGQTFQIVDADPTATGNFSSFASNLSGDSFSYAPTTGILTVLTAVPEPGTGIQAGVALLLVIGAGAFKQIKRRTAVCAG